MFQQVRLSPSILSADFMNMARDLAMMEGAGADWVHVDVMDGHFVPNLTMGVPLVKQLKETTSLPLDVHLMISNPEVQIPWFIDAGADIITFHIEATDLPKAKEIIGMIHDAGAKAGVSIKPKTPVDAIEELIPLVDMVLIMSVEPGFSGQSYIGGSEDKVAEVSSICKTEDAVNARRANGLDDAPIIQVDGGIGMSTLAPVVAAGADMLVCGNAVFAADDAAQAIASIKDAAEEARAKAIAADDGGDCR